MSYLCNRNRETKIANDKVPWMSGLVSGLQNRVRRFESARNLQKQERIRMKISNPFVFQQLTSSVVEVEKGGLSTPAPSINYITDIHLHAKSNNKPFSPRMTNVNILWTGAI